MVLLTAIGMYMVTKSFYVHDIASHPTLLVLALPGIFLGFLYTLEIKFRKSPFDLSCSHHAHQELVRGITTEFSGRTLALIEIAHWYENVFLLGWVYLFFASSPVLGVAVSLLVFGFVILVDNVFARLKWQTACRAPGWWPRCWASAISWCFRGCATVERLDDHEWHQKIPLDHPLRRLELQRLRHRGAGLPDAALRCRAPGRGQHRQPQARGHLPGDRRGQRAEQGGHPQHLPPVARAQSRRGRGHLRLQRRHLPRVLQHQRRRGQRHPGGRLCPRLRRPARGHHRRRGQGASGCWKRSTGR